MSTPASQMPKKKGSAVKGKGLSKTWHGVPVAVIGVGGVVGVFFVYKWWKGKQSAAASTTAAATPASASTGTGSLDGGSGTGTGSGGGGTGTGAGGRNRTRPTTTPTSGGGSPLFQPAPTPSVTPATTPAAVPAPNPALETGPNASGGYTPAQVQAAQPTAPTTFPFTTIFTGSNGTVYYGVGNQTALAAAKAAGYTVTNAQAAGVPGGTTKAQYVYKA